MTRCTIDVTEETFDQDVLQHPGLVLLDFWNELCGPCRMLSPVLEDLCREFPQVRISKVNANDNLNLALQFRVSYLPTLVLLRDGQEVDRVVGAQGKAQLKGWIEANLK